MQACQTCVFRTEHGPWHYPFYLIGTFLLLKKTTFIFWYYNPKVIGNHECDSLVEKRWLHLYECYKKFKIKTYLNLIHTTEIFVKYMYPTCIMMLSECCKIQICNHGLWGNKRL